MTTATTQPFQTIETKPVSTRPIRGGCWRPPQYLREIGLVRRIDVGVHLLATERLIIELRSLEPGELSMLYSWVGRVIDPAMVRSLIAAPLALRWRNIRRSDIHAGESYARLHTLYVHIHAPYEPRTSLETTHERVQRRFLEWIEPLAVRSSAKTHVKAG